MGNNGLCPGRHEPAAALSGKDSAINTILDYIGLRIHCTCNAVGALDLNDGLGAKTDPDHFRDSHMPHLSDGLVFAG